MEWGHGKRNSVLSDYTFAVRDDETGELRTIGKAYSGLTDQEILELTPHFQQTTLAVHGKYHEVQAGHRARGRLRLDPAEHPPRQRPFHAFSPDQGVAARQDGGRDDTLSYARSLSVQRDERARPVKILNGRSAKKVKRLPTNLSIRGGSMLGWGLPFPLRRMSSPGHRVRRRLHGALALLLWAGLIAGVRQGEAASNAADVSFATSKTVLWLGHTQIIPLHLKAPADADTAVSASVLDPRLVEVVRPAMFLAGEQTAYLRVRALHAGQTRLEVFGGPALELEVKPDPAEPANASIDQESRQPRIISPMPGAVVWGEFAVGVTMFDGSPSTVVPSGNASPAGDAKAAAAKAVKVQLRLPAAACWIRSTRHRRFTARAAVPISVPAGDFADGRVAVGRRGTDEAGGVSGLTGGDNRSRARLWSCK